MSYHLTDKLNRELGTISRTWALEGGLGGRFHPGKDFEEVESLFEKYDSYLGYNDEPDLENTYSELVKLKPRIISHDDNSIKYFHCALISKVPDGYSITLVEKNA